MSQVINRPDHFRGRERIELFPGFILTIESALFNIKPEDADGFLEINWASEVGKRDAKRYLFKVITKLDIEILALFDEYKLAQAIARGIEKAIAPFLMEPITVIAMALADGFGFSYQRHCTLPRVEREVPTI